jgi:hypothetical protein
VSADTRDLIEIEAIKAMKARYCRLVDTKCWDEWGELLTLDAILEHPANRPEPIEGRAAIVASVSAGFADIISVHHVHSPEIALHGPDAAAGIWAMDDLLIGSPPDSEQFEYHGHGHYFEDYVKTGQGWQISHIRISRLLVERRLHSRVTLPPPQQFA